MAIGDNNEKYYAPTYSPTTYASDAYANQDYGNGGYWNGDYYDPEKVGGKTPTEIAMTEAFQEFKKREGGEHDPNPPSGKEVARTAENNYGYEDLGLLGDISSIAGKVIGGPVGMVLGMPNRLESIANINTVPAAREDLGLKAGKKTSVIGAAVKGTPTHVGTVNIGNATYNVDVDPKTWGKIDPVTGVTTIGPAEAKKNAIENQQQITEVEAPEEAPSAPKGPIGKALAAAKETLTGVKEAPTEQETPSTPSAPAIGATPGYNPDAPSPAQNVGLNAQPSNPASVSTSAQGNFSKGLTDPATTNDLGVDRGQTIADRSKTALGGYAAGKGYGSAATNQKSTIGGINDDFAGRLQSLSENLSKQGISVGVFSGARTPEHQAGIVSGMMGRYGFSPAQVAQFDKDVATLGAVAAGNKWAGALKEAGLTQRAAPPGRSMHQKGVAVDMSYTDPVTGQTMSIGRAPKAVQDALAAEAQKLGLSTPVTGEPWHVEPVDVRNPNVTTYGIQAVPESMAPTPGQKPTNPADVGAIARNAYDTQYGVEAPASIAENTTVDSMSNMTADATSKAMSAAQAMNAPDTMSQGLAAMNAGYTPGTAMSPSNLSSVGMGYSYSPADISAMGYAFSGELGPNTRAALANPDNPNYQDAVNELAGMISSLDNRVNAVASVGMKDPVNANLNKAYDSVNKGFAQQNTAQAYAKDGVNVTNTVRGILDGTIAATNPAQQATHYGTPGALSKTGWANPDVASPSQMAAAQSFADTSVSLGAHTFGNLGPTEKGMAASTKGYGTAYGPAGAVGVSGVSGQTHSPGAMYGGATTTAGTPGGYAGANTNALGGGLGLGGGYVSGTNTGTGATSMGQSPSSESNSGLGGTSSSANGNTAGSGDSGSSSSGNGNSSGSGGGSDGAGSSGSSGGLGGRGGDDDHDGGDGRGR